ncbi:MAG: hypothetical protein WBO55_15925 [Rhizobiaceae bacterium]
MSDLWQLQYAQVDWRGGGWWGVAQQRAGEYAAAEQSLFLSERMLNWQFAGYE